MKIGVWGDSITYGEGDKNSLGWVGLLRNKLEKNEICVYNRGICGDTTEDLLKRFEVEMTSIKPDTIIIAVGINDAKFPNGKDENKVLFSTFQNNIKELITKAKTKANNITVVGLTDVNEKEIKSASIFTNKVIRKYDEQIQKISQDENINFISMQGVLNTFLDLEDGIHPNGSGYKKMFEVILPFIKNLR